jgi:hypothetical protein
VGDLFLAARPDALLTGINQAMVNGRGYTRRFLRTETGPGSAMRKVTLPGHAASRRAASAGFSACQSHATSAGGGLPIKPSNPTSAGEDFLRQLSALGRHDGPVISGQTDAQGSLDFFQVGSSHYDPSLESIMYG